MLNERPNRREQYLYGAAILATPLLCTILSPSSLLMLPAVLVCCFVVRHEAAFDAYVERHPWHNTVVAGSWATLVVALLLGDNLRADWGVIDDHAIAHLLGPTGELTLADACSQFAAHREIGSPGFDFVRYRPVFWSLRIVEAYLWGDSPRLWYGSRLVYFAVSLALFWTLLRRWLGSLAGSLLLLALLVYPFWKDVWCRLAPSEIFGVPGIALYLTGAVQVCRQETGVGTLRRLGSWSLIVAGALLAFGSKENFLILVPATWLLVGRLAWQKRLDWIGVVSTGLMTACGLGIAVVVGLSLRNIGYDVHLQDVDPLRRLTLLGDLASMLAGRREGLFIAAGLVAAGGVTVWAWRLGRGREALAVVVRAGLLVAAFAVVLASQFLFYDGRWPKNNRCDFPGLLSLPLIGVTLAWAALVLVERLTPRGRLFLRAGFVSVLVCCVVRGGFADLRHGARANVAATTRFARNLDSIVPQLLAAPDRPVLFVSHQPLDYEPVLSVRRFLRARHVTNPIFLQLDGYDSATVESPRYRALTRVLEERSANGHAIPDQRLPDDRFEPLGQLPQDAPVFALDFLPDVEIKLRPGGYAASFQQDD